MTKNKKTSRFLTGDLMDRFADELEEDSGSGKTKLPALYSAAQRALAAAVKVEQAAYVKNIAEGLEALAIKARYPDFAADAARLKVGATRRLGVLIKSEKAAGKLAKGTRGQISGKKAGTSKGKGKAKAITGAVSSTAPVMTLAQRGVDTNLAKRARRLEAMLDGEYQKYLIKIIRIAVAAAEGNREVVLAAKAERHAAARARRAEREAAVASKIAALPDKRYGVVYADPEWTFKTYSEKGKLETSAENSYTTSALEVIKARDVPSISAPDCVLFLWATAPMVREALEVMKAWGFEYKSQVIWKKDKGGTGYWFINWHELLLVGTRGGIPAPAQGTLWPSVIEAPRGRHSEKPDRFYELIEAYYPNIQKIELNARAAREGWTSWGFEAPGLSEAAE